MDNTTCKNCNKSFATKYTLKKHIETKICENDKPSEFLCSSNRCDFKTLKKFDLHRHLKICKYVGIDEAVKQCNIENNKIIVIKDNEINELKHEIDMIVDNIQRDHKREIENIRSEHLIKEKYMGKERDHLVSLLEKTYTRQNNDTSYDFLIKNKNDYIAILEARLTPLDI